MNNKTFLINLIQIKWPENPQRLFSSRSFLSIEPKDVSKFSDTTPTDPSIK
jgi:hypothetical protein